MPKRGTGTNRAARSLRWSCTAILQSSPLSVSGTHQIDPDGYWTLPAAEVMHDVPVGNVRGSSCCEVVLPGAPGSTLRDLVLNPTLISGGSPFAGSPHTPLPCEVPGFSLGGPGVQAARVGS